MGRPPPARACSRTRLARRHSSSTSRNLRPTSSRSAAAEIDPAAAANEPVSVVENVAALQQSPGRSLS
eukprot:5103558-Alexandrium_andersonii.AAC.1